MTERLYDAEDNITEFNCIRTAFTKKLSHRKQDAPSSIKDINAIPLVERTLYYIFMNIYYFYDMLDMEIFENSFNVTQSTVEKPPCSKSSVIIIFYLFQDTAIFYERVHSEITQGHRQRRLSVRSLA